MNEYRYAVARIRALEKNLLSHNIVDRFIDSPTIVEAVKVLSETEYGPYFSELESVYEFEKAINRHLAYVYKVIEDSTRNPDFTLIYRYRYDFHNLKAIIKSNDTGEDYENKLIPMGSVEVEKISRAIYEKELSYLPPFLRKAAEEFEFNQEPQVINYIIDRYLYRTLLETATGLGPFAVEFIKTEIDLININTFLRVRKTGLSLEKLKEALLTGGYLPPSFYLDIFNEPLNILADRLSVTRYEKIVNEGIQDWLDSKDASRIEKVLDNYLLTLARRGIYAASGIEPVLGFLQAKENESRLLRLLFVSKINRISADKIRERLRDMYV